MSDMGQIHEYLLFSRPSPMPGCGCLNLPDLPPTRSATSLAQLEVLHTVDNSLPPLSPPDPSPPQVNNWAHPTLLQILPPCLCEGTQHHALTAPPGNHAARSIH